MEPGDMVLYESGSLMHGRPFPMKGRYYANIFIHFVSISILIGLASRSQPSFSYPTVVARSPLQEPTGKSLGRKIPEGGANEDDEFYPPYLLKNSPELETWASSNPYGWKKASPSAAQVDTPEGHFYAQQGDVDGLKALAVKNPKALLKKDRNGWTPLHEAIRIGHTESVKYLISVGADKDARTHHGAGGTPLNLAITELTENHPVSRYLKDIGATNIGPDEL
jgi:prolyl 4-hydroxylase